MQLRAGAVGGNKRAERHQMWTNGISVKEQNGFPHDIGILSRRSLLSPSFSFIWLDLEGGRRNNTNDEGKNGIQLPHERGGCMTEAIMGSKVGDFGRVGVEGCSYGAIRSQTQHLVVEG
eukprot:749263-Hanusia_phi.AAC.6